MSILKQNFAPITDTAWEEINHAATDIFKTMLSARKFADFDGPKGWNFGAVSLGRLNILEKQKGKVEFGVNQVMPLIEVRHPFKLKLWELDNTTRGAEDIDLDALEKAAAEVAAFEEKTIYYGLKEAGIKGLVKSAENAPLEKPKKTEQLLGVVSQGINTLTQAGVEGPYALVVNPTLWNQIASHTGGYPLKRQLENLLQGRLIVSEFVSETLLISQRGGDFRITSGVDLSVGYHAHTSTEVELYFTESFTFQVIDPAALIVIQ